MEEGGSNWKPEVLLEENKGRRGRLVWRCFPEEKIEELEVFSDGP